MQSGVMADRHMLINVRRMVTTARPTTCGVGIGAAGVFTPHTGKTSNSATFVAHVILLRVFVEEWRGPVPYSARLETVTSIQIILGAN